MATTPQTASEALAAGNEALHRGAWDDARWRFEAALAAEDSAAAWEGLGWAAYWLSDASLTLRAREQAYRAFRAAGDPTGAGRVAAWLSADFLEFRGEDAVARGWLERAHRMLDGHPECADHGWLALHEGSYLMNVPGDLDGAETLADRGVTLGRKLGVPDLEAIGLALKGITLVRRGRVEDGMRLLDEASVIGASEDMQIPLSRGWALCYLISACEGVGDFPRAVQWCSAARGLAERWGARQLIGVCRSAYGHVLATNGDWAAAELELTGAIVDLETSRPAMAGGALARLGELRARQGRADEARELFERAGNHPRAFVGLGAFALDSGDPAAAVDAADRVLRRLAPDAVLDRLPALELLVRARAALGEFEAAADGSAELERIGAELGTPYVRGRARLVAGQMAAARGDHEQARRVCEDAVDLLTEAAAAYETALARLELARALAALGRAEPAAAEARLARAAFAALGAERDVARADAALDGEREVGGADAAHVGEREAAGADAAHVGERNVGGADAAHVGERNVGGADAVLGELTPREVEVLRLVAQGLSDAEIAARLVLSQHTVHRHVANVRAKLRLPSRAAAVAYAARAGLL